MAAPSDPSASPGVLAWMNSAGVGVDAYLVVDSFAGQEALATVDLDIARLTTFTSLPEDAVATVLTTGS
jgi:hypothetical protein